MTQRGERNRGSKAGRGKGGGHGGGGGWWAPPRGGTDGLHLGNFEETGVSRDTKKKCWSRKRKDSG